MPNSTGVMPPTAQHTIERRDRGGIVVPGATLSAPLEAC
jgi:hypothetical protein